VLLPLLNAPFYFFFISFFVSQHLPSHLPLAFLSVRPCFSGSTNMPLGAKENKSKEKAKTDEQYKHEVDQGEEQF